MLNDLLNFLQVANNYQFTLEFIHMSPWNGKKIIMPSMSWYIK